MEKKIKKNLFVYKFTTFVILLSVFQTTLSNDVTNDEKVCTGTVMKFTSNVDDYLKWKATYTDCVYVDGNVEINSFAPYDGKNSEYGIQSYDFSFLDNIKEITGYLLIHGNKHLKTLKFKNLQLIRGKSLLFNKISLYIENNMFLESLDLKNLKEIQRGTVYIKKNPKLCNMNEVNWPDLAPGREKGLMISNNADPAKCTTCSNTCVNKTEKNPLSKTHSGCWYPNGCQTLTKVICDKRCEGSRCYGSGALECCHSQCLGGCTGPLKRDCIACTKLRMKTTGECIETCPRVQMLDPITHELVYNPDGMYQYGITCVKSCPRKKFTYKGFCLKNCPNNTYEDEELMQNPETGEKGMRRLCKPCTSEKCIKTCSIDAELTTENIKSLEGCVVLKSNLIIMNDAIVSNKFNSSNLPRELNETDLSVLSSLKVINGFVRIQSNTFKNLSFLKNLEVIRGNDIIQNRYSVIIISQTLKTLNLNKLKKIENGIVYLHTSKLCLFDTIDWKSILDIEKSFIISDKNREYLQTNQCAKDSYTCDSACSGCWSTGSESCQLCKNYKLDEECIEKCDNNFQNGRFTYIQNYETRECKYCHPGCKSGCTGPTEYECHECKSFYVTHNSTLKKCVDKCPISHYFNNSTKSIYSINDGSQICLQCHKNCYGCTGPMDSLGYGGCNKCSSALVRNDDEYSVIKCIEKEEYKCTKNEFSTLVPKNLVKHPLKGKEVCRKCDDECENCIMSGVKLGEHCMKCRNYFSSLNGNCVKNCSSLTEYLEKGTKNCIACNSECKGGCTGYGNFKCKECRTYKLFFKDAENIIISKADKVNLQSESFGLLSYSAKIAFLNELANYDTNDLNEIINNLENFYSYQITHNVFEPNETETYGGFCISSCPPEFPYNTNKNVCSSNVFPLEFKIIFIFMLIVVSGIFLIFIVLISLWQRRIKIIEKENEEKFFSPDFNHENGSYESDSTKVNMSNLRLININELELSKVLGRGAFGTVYEGYYKPFNKSNYKVRVAIKVLNKCKLSDEKAVTRLSEELINEAKVMASVDHEYCLRLTALCLAEPMMMVTQLMQFGSVVTFYQKYRDIVNEKMLLTWSKQIAEGMDYLESRGIVHRDLAARNILVKKIDQIKITDFGLARILDKEEGIYVFEYSLVPFKWLAIESIKNKLFNHKSDVWSYGICLWEIFTFCSKPYAEFPENDPLTIFNCILKGTRLAKPRMATLDVYIILLRCWLENPIARPDFKTLANEFSNMCMDPKRYLSIDKSNYDEPFTTIDNNTQDLLQEFKTDNPDYFETPIELNPRSNSESSDKNTDKSLKDDYVDPETASSGFGDTSSNNERFDSKKYDEQQSKGLVKIFKRQTNDLKIPNSASPLYMKQTSFNLDSSSYSNNNKRRFRNLFFNRFSNKSKRLNSEISSGIGSTYISNSCSSVSLSPQVSKDKNLNFNFYEEQEQLLNNMNTSYRFTSSSTPSRSNSDSTHTSDLASNRCSSIYKTQRSTTQNSDYLEPILTNVMQNFEYFGEENEKRTPPIIIMPDVKNEKRNYYNDDISHLLKKHVKTTDI